MTNTNTTKENKMTKKTSPELRVFQYQPDADGHLTKRRIRWNARFMAWKILQAKNEENKKN